MKILHVNIEADDGWLLAQGLEEPGLITQARTWDELLGNIREVIELLEIGDKELHMELIVPPSVRQIIKQPPRRKHALRGKFRAAAIARR